MNRTEEYRRIVNNQQVIQNTNEPEDSTTAPLLNIAKELRTSINSCYISLKNRRAHDYTEIENTIGDLVKKSNRILELIEEIAENNKYLEGVAINIKSVVKRTEIKLEERKSKKIRPTLNIALEPEKSTAVVKTKPVQMQILHEENERILERVRYTEREIAQIRRKVSEIDTLQRLITQELYVQDERIDVILNNTSTATVDVKISRTYIRNSEEKKQVAKRFISLFVMILSIVLLVLHHSNK